MARRRRNLPALDQINLTSLLDLTFVLLIAFMIVAPSLRPEMVVDLPELEDSEGTGTTDNNSIIIVIKKQVRDSDLPKIYFTQKGKNDKRVDLEELKDNLKAAKQRNPKTDVSIEVDGKANVDLFLKVMGAARAAGFPHVKIPHELMEN